jgi:hypothetical protein
MLPRVRAELTIEVARTLMARCAEKQCRKDFERLKKLLEA